MTKVSFQNTPCCSRAWSLMIIQQNIHTNNRYLLILSTIIFRLYQLKTIKIPNYALYNISSAPLCTNYRCYYCYALEPSPVQPAATISTQRLPAAILYCTAGVKWPDISTRNLSIANLISFHLFRHY